MKQMVSRLALATGLVVVHLSGALASPADGKRDFTPFVSSTQEKQIGQQEHPKILAEYGGAYPDDNVAGYVAQVGGRMALNSELAKEPFTYTLLNSRVLNAFALPGGYIYITRQLLTLMNDEAELASVLGHETGHVTDRHTAKRETRSQIEGVLAGVLGAVTGSNLVAGLLGQAAQMETLSYSRGQEYKADALGIRYITRAGYDPGAAADMLRALGGQTDFDTKLSGGVASQAPSWARTHPLTADRVTKASQLAAQAVAQGKATATQKSRNRNQFLTAIDGLVIDDTADQGFIYGQSFSHKKLKFTFSVPQGYRLDNGDAAVVATGPSGAQLQFVGGALAAGQSLDDDIAQAWSKIAGQSGTQLGAARHTTINGMETAIAAVRAQTQNGQVDVAIVAYRFNPTTAYHFIISTPAEVTPQVDSGLQQMINSFRQITATEAANLHERRLQVVTVKTGDTVQSLAQRMAYSDNQVERFQVLNGLSVNDVLPKGQRVKLVVMAKN